MPATLCTSVPPAGRCGCPSVLRGMWKGLRPGWQVAAGKQAAGLLTNTALPKIQLALLETELRGLGTPSAGHTSGVRGVLQALHQGQVAFLGQHLDPQGGPVTLSMTQPGSVFWSAQNSLCLPLVREAGGSFHPTAGENSDFHAHPHHWTAEVSSGQAAFPLPPAPPSGTRGACGSPLWATGNPTPETHLPSLSSGFRTPPP